MIGDDDLSVDTLLANLIDEITGRLQAGETIDLDEYVARYPEHSEELQQLLPALTAIGSFGDAAASTEDHGPRFGLPECITQSGTIGDFRIIREVGRGGMGVVYEAQQISLDRRVALKVLPFSGLLDRRHLARFMAEARAAASLHHTNIVPVYSVGSQQGTHFYAMQFIDGFTLADVIRQMTPADDATPAKVALSEPGDDSQTTDSKTHGEESPSQSEVDTVVAGLTVKMSSGPTERFRTVAQLGVQAAEAIEYAHANGIIHRDIKPSNLLIDTDDRLWITDFGLAQVSTDVGLTISGDLLGTLRYMSPEQAADGPVLLDHRTDVYSLGLTLYELLTLKPALDGRHRQQLLRQIADHEPPPPRRFNSNIPIDLETIVLKAIAKEPRRRYSSADAMAQDLRRFLESKPILARRPSVVERLRKWSRRHRAVVTTALCAAVLAVIGLSVASGLILQQKRQAKTNLDVAREVIDNLYVELRNQPGTAQLQIKLLEKLVQIYEDKLERGEGDEQMKHDAAITRRRLAEQYGHQGEYEPAIFNYLQTRDDLRELIDDGYDELTYQVELAQCRHELGEVQLAKGNEADARIALHDAHADRMRLVNAYPRQVNYQHDLAWTQSLLGQSYQQEGKIKAAQQWNDKSLKISRPLAIDFSGQPDYQRLLARGLFNRGYYFLLDGKHVQARQSIQQAIDKLQEMRIGQKPIDQARLAICYNCVAATVIDPTEAQKWVELGLAINLDLTSKFPGMSVYQISKSNNIQNIAQLLATGDNALIAIDKWKESAADCEKLAKQFPRLGQFSLLAARAKVRQAMVHIGEKQFDDASECFREAVGRLAPLKDTDLPPAQYAPQLAEARFRLATSHYFFGNRSLARQEFTQAIGDYQGLLRDDGEHRHAHLLRLLVALLTVPEPSTNQLNLATETLSNLSKDFYEDERLLEQFDAIVRFRRGEDVESIVHLNEDDAVEAVPVALNRLTLLASKESIDSKEFTEEIQRLLGKSDDALVWQICLEAAETLGSRQLKTLAATAVQNRLELIVAGDLLVEPFPAVESGRSGWMQRLPSESINNYRQSR